MNKNITIGILVVAVVIIGGYAIWKTVEKPAPVVQIIDNSQSPTLNQPSQNNPPVTVPPTPNPQPAPTSVINNYKDTQNHFQIDLPTGVSVLQSSQSPSGTSGQVTTHYGVPGLHNFDVSNTTCVASAGSTNVVFNGISFLKTTSSGTFGGMESGSFDATYCAMYNGQSYSFTFTHQYNRVNGSPQPDMVTTYQKFDQEMQALNLKFI